MLSTTPPSTIVRDLVRGQDEATVRTRQRLRDAVARRLESMTEAEGRAWAERVTIAYVLAKRRVSFPSVADITDPTKKADAFNHYTRASNHADALYMLWFEVTLSLPLYSKRCLMETWQARLKPYRGLYRREIRW